MDRYLPLWSYSGLAALTNRLMCEKRVFALYRISWKFTPVVHIFSTNVDEKRSRDEQKNKNEITVTIRTTTTTALRTKKKRNLSSLLSLLQNGTINEDKISAVASGGDDGSVVLAGSTAGNWDIVNRGYEDFAAVKLDANGTVLWHWQVSCTYIKAKGGGEGEENWKIMKMHESRERGKRCPQFAYWSTVVEE